MEEKWFFLTRVMERYYLVPDEEQPHQAIGHSQVPHPQVHAPDCEWTTKMGRSAQPVVLWKAWTMASGTGLPPLYLQ